MAPDKLRSAIVENLKAGTFPLPTKATQRSAIGALLPVPLRTEMLIVQRKTSEVNRELLSELLNAERLRGHWRAAAKAKSARP